MIFSVFTGVLDAFSSVSTNFRLTLQVLHLNVSKVDRVLHLPRFFVVSSRCLFLLLAALAGHPPPPPPLLDAGDVQGGTSGARNGARKGQFARAIRRPVSIRTSGR
jgi:hypothetical protein